MDIDPPKKYSQEELLETIPTKPTEIIFICEEIYNPIGYTQAVIRQIVYGNMLITPEEVFKMPGIYILHIDSNDFSDKTTLLYDSTCVFVYDVILKYFRYGPMTTHDNIPFWAEEFTRLEY